MQKIFTEDLSVQVKEIFADMPKELTIALFVDKNGCETCEETKNYMNEVAELGEKINVEIYDINDDSALASEYNVVMVPSIVLLDSNKDYHGVKFNGISLPIRNMSIEKLLSFYMGKNTPSRQEFIINNLKVELDIIEEAE